MAASATSLEYVQKMYIAYFGRPAAPTGQEYYGQLVDAGNVAALQDDFWNSAESQALFNQPTTEGKVNAIFNQLFGRDAKTAGLTYWTVEINAGRVSLPSAALTILNSADAADSAVFNAKMDVANAFTAELDTTTEVLAYQSNTAGGRTTLTAVETQAEADAAVAGITTIVAAVVAGGSSETDTYTLTNGSDVKTAHIFNAPKGYTPGGTDQVNTLSDDDILTGTGLADDVLNLTYVNDADTGDNNIAPVMSKVETINVKFALDYNATLDLQDTTGVLNINLSRIDDGNTATIDNITEASSNNLSINNSSAPDSNVNFTYTSTALTSATDSVTLTLNNAQLAAVRVEENKAIPNQGFETFNLVSTGAANTMTSLQAEDVKSLIISGDEDLSIFGTAQITDNISGSVLVEAIDTNGGLLNMAGSLTLIDASKLTGNLSINLNNVLHATADGTSGTDVAVSVIGASGNDTFWIGNGVDANDTIDGGTGGNTAILVGGTVSGNINNTQTLDVRADAAAVTVDTSKLAQLTDIVVRNEGNDNAVAPVSLATPTVVTLNNVSSAVAANGINVLHGTTYNNAIDDLTLNVDLATDGVADSVVYTLGEGVNSDPRFNLTVTSTDFETVKIEDNDSESNTIAMTGTKPVTKLEVTGGVAGTFLNLDYTIAPEGDGVDAGIYGKDTSDSFGVVVGGTNDLSVDTNATFKQIYTSVDKIGTGAAAAVFVTTTIDASTQVSDLIVRVGSKESQTVKLGLGSDTVVFDASVDRAGDLSTEYAHAGLTNSDTVSGGTGTDTLAVDGESGTGITLQQSEWQNVSGMDQIYIVSNNGSSVYTNGTGFNFNYRLDITDGLINSTDGGSTLAIRNDATRSDVTVLGFADETGVRNADLLLDLTNLNDSTNTVTYDGAEGADGTLRLVLDDASFNGLNTIDGGDTNTTTADTGTGNDNVIEVRNDATVTIADLALLTNFSAIEFVSTSSSDQLLNLDLSDVRLDALSDNNHAATALQREAFAVRTYQSGSDNADLVLNTTNVVGNFDLTINTVGTGNSGDDILRIGVSTATDYTIATGHADTVDTIELFGTAPGFILDATAPALDYTLQYLDVLGNLTGVVSDIGGVEVLDLRNYTDAAGGNANNVLVAGNVGMTTIVTNNGFTIGGSAGNDVIVAGAGAQVITDGTGADNIAGGAGLDNIFIDSTDASIDTVTLGDTVAGALTADADTIFGFTAASTDVIALSITDLGAGFTSAVGAGFSVATDFVIIAGGVAAAATNRVIYNSTNGQLTYDADGNGAGAAVTLATLVGVPAITAADFVVVA